MGPEILLDNDELVGISLQNSGPEQLVLPVRKKATNPILMKVLNVHYGEKYR